MGAERETSVRSRLVAGRYRLAVAALGVVMAVELLTRLTLWTVHGNPAADGVAATLRALAAGEAYDLLIALWLVLPLVLYLSVLPRRFFQARWHRAWVAMVFAAWLYGLLFAAVAEWFFFAEFESRFNFVAVDYLLYPTEVLTNIWESYPTGWILAALGVAAAAAAWAVWRWRPAAVAEPRRRWRAAVAAAAVTAVVFGTWAASPGWARVSDDRVLNELAGNGFYGFFAALRGSRVSYEDLYASLPQRHLFPRLQRLLDEPGVETGSFEAGTTRRFVRNAGPARRLNVVVVLEESLGSEFLSRRRGSEASLAPRLEALARRGTLLTHVYSTGNRTIRAIEATTAGLPPLPGVSIVRRPQSQHLFTLPELLRGEGYQTLFVYGGRALFDGVGGYLRANGVERVIEQSDFPDGTFHTAWGVADEAIFDRALGEMDAMATAGRPFYTLVLTVSNHRPYSFPEGEVRWDPDLKGRENAVRYADWALGRFMDRAREHPWYGSTLFVLMGDHGARVYGAAEVPLGSYEVPVLLIGPGVAAHERVATLASSLDVPPTILGRLGLDYESRFFGHDVLRLEPERGRALLNHNNEVALLRGRRLAVLGLRGATAVYDCDLERVECAPVEAPTAADRELVQDAIAYYDGADVLYRTGAYRWDGPEPAPAGDRVFVSEAAAAAAAAGDG
jgi:phosphoglycerol transferase MdoB-like AlkP superfamily enzyme